MFSYAASYFGNADAQYDLARLYLKASALAGRFPYGARWLGLAAQKGQHQAQALLGQMLFNGDQIAAAGRARPDVADLAHDSATADETWIKESYNKAIAKASEDDRAWHCRCSSTGCRAARTNRALAFGRVGWAKAPLRRAHRLSCFEKKGGHASLAYPTLPLRFQRLRLVRNQRTTSCLPYRRGRVGKAKRAHLSFF